MTPEPLRPGNPVATDLPEKANAVRLSFLAPYRRSTVLRNSSDEEDGMHSRERERLLDEVPTTKPAPVAVPEAQLRGDAPDVLALQRRAGNQAVARMVTQARQRQIQRVPIGGVNVTPSGGYPSWTWGGDDYHFNLRYPESLHITKDVAREHYYFSVERTYVRGAPVTEFTDLVGTGHQKKSMGKQEHKEHRRRYSELPLAMRQWFEANYDQILAVQ